MNKRKLVKIVKDFITDDEVKILNQWTLDHYKNPYFMDPKMNSDKKQTRFTTRHAWSRSEEEYKDYKVEYPKEVYDIKKRLIEYLNVNEYNIAPWPSFTDGIVTTIAFPPGSCCKHTDPVYYENTYTLHCNFVTQNPKSGGITHVEDTPYQFGEKDMLMYITSHLDHEVTEISGDTPRILWVYGFCLSLLKMNKTFGISTFDYR